MSVLSTSKLLNPELYNSLSRTFGQVRVMNLGVAMRYAVAHNSVSGDKEINIREWGETYKVCCPKCGDRRFRLLINHRHDTTEPLGSTTGSP